MSSDITRVFISTVRALSTSLKFPKSISSSTTTEEFATTLDVDPFTARARLLYSELVAVRGYLSNAEELSHALVINDVAPQRMYHKVAEEINSALEQCGQLLLQLRRRCVGGEAGRGQGSEHRKSMCRSLEELFRTLQRARDEQVATYCRQVKLAGRLGEALPPYQDSSLSSGLRKRGGNVESRSFGDTSWLFGSTGSNDAEALPSDSLPEAELKQLEMENAEVYLRFLSERTEIQQLGNQISEIGRLQAIVTENLMDQAEMAHRIGEQVVSSTELVKEANEHLRQSMDKTRTVRFWIIFILFTLTFSLHFLDWYS